MGVVDPSPDPGANLREECDRVVELARELQESASVFLSQTWNQEQSLRQRALALDSAIQRLQSSVVSAAKTEAIDPKDAEKVTFLTLNPLRRFCYVSVLISVDFWVLLLKLNEELCRARCVITDGDVSSFLPTKSHVLAVQLILNIIVPPPGSPMNLYLFLTATGLHYNASFIADALALTTCVAMLLQNRYQRQRLYTRIALGKAKRMDVVWGETAGVSGQLWLLCPILFILQGFEAYVGLLLVKMAVADVISEWQARDIKKLYNFLYFFKGSDRVIVCGVLLVVMAVGNFVNTVQTLITKSRFKAKMKKGKIRHESEQEPPRGDPKPVTPS
ncbi:hypothetical protein ACLOJK_032173 [Asimina triloba]